MPELAEVELARRIWEPALGQRIIAIDTHPHTRVYRDTPAASIESSLSLQTLLASRTHGKRLLFSFDPNARSGPRLKKELPSLPPPQAMLHLELHLGMSGRLFLAAPDYPTAKHDHFILRTRELSLVYSDYRQFGRVFLHPPVADPWSALPFEVLDRRFTLTYLNRVTSRRGGTSLKALLLDQAIFPGVGNWMADEICWRLPCHPAKKLRDLELGLVRKVSRQICRGAMRHVADKNSPRDGSEGFSPGRYVEQVPPPSWLFQHRWKAGGHCPRCHSGLARGTVATRTTAWCPSCQGAA